MPVVPYKPVPDVGASQQAIQGVDVPTPIAAFGGTIASAIESAGRSVEKAGDEIFQRAMALQQLQNETEAREADAEYTIAVGELRAKYHSLEGRNAVDAYPQFVRDLRETQQQFRGRLSNPMSQRMFDRESRSMMARTIFNGAGHSATENRRWAEKASLARVDNNINVTLNDPTPNAVRQAETSIEQESHTLAGLNGWDEAVREQFVREKTSQTMLTHLRGLAKRDPFAAKKFLEENRGRFDDRHISAADQVVQTNLYQMGSRTISNEINDQPAEGGENLERRIERGMTKAKELVPNDEEFAGFVRDRIITDYNRQNGVRRETVLARRNVVEGALMGQFGDGSLPTSPEQLRASDPKAAEAWDALDARTQRSYLRAMAQNAKGDVAWTSDNLRRYQTLKGLAHEKPEEFLGINVVDEKMPASARRELVNLQQRLRGRVEADPRVTRALQTLRPMLRSAGIMPDQDRDRYYQFVGTLQDALVQYQKDHPGKFPSQEEVQKIGSALITPTKEPGAWWGTVWMRNTPLFELSLPSQLLEQFKNDPRWQGRSPSDSEIELFRRQYIRRRYQELFGSASSGGQTANPVPTVPISR